MGKSILSFPLAASRCGKDKPVPDRAVVGAESCGRCSPIVRSFPARREAARKGLCKAFGLLKKRFGLFIKTPKHFDQKPETFFRALYGRETVAVDLPVQVERIDVRHA